MTTFQEFNSRDYDSERHEYSYDSHEEAEPGVYVRDQEREMPGELDILWSGNKSLHKEERSPFIPFTIGFVLGVLLTGAVCWLLFIRPHVETKPNDMTSPIQAKPENESDASKNTRVQNLLGNSTTYTVVAGDTLGKISLKVYGSTAPKYQEKIQRANNMKNPNHLKLDQTLTIPPKEY